MENNHDLTKGNVFSVLTRFAVPFLLANLLQTMYGAVDLIVVGKFSDAAGVSAVATGSQVMQTITGIILGLSTGGTVLIGQYLGAKREKDVAKTMGTIIYSFATLAGIFTVIMLILTRSIVSVVNVPVEAVKFTTQYIFICSLGIPLIVGYNTVCAILRGLGDSRSPLYFVAAACTFNIAGDLVLAGVFKMGAAGVAIATIAAQGISLIIAIVFLKKKGFCFEFNKSYIKFDREKAKKIFKIGVPIALQDGLVNISFIIITAIINSMGVLASASVGVVEKIIVFTMLPASSFASAIAAMTAQNIGAKKLDRAKKCLYCGIGTSLVFAVFFCVTAQIKPTLFTAIFASDPKIVNMAGEYFKSYSIDCILVSFVFCMNSFFSGCGHSTFPMVHSLIATFFVRIPGSYLLSRTAGVTLYKMGFVAPLSTLLSLIICIIYMRFAKLEESL